MRSPPSTSRCGTCTASTGRSDSRLLGPTVNRTVPGYLSGLPAATLDERVALANEKYAAGHRAFKFAAVVSHEGIVAEMAALRAALGPRCADHGRPALEVHRRRGARADRCARAVSTLFRRSAGQAGGSSRTGAGRARKSRSYRRRRRMVHGISRPQPARRRAARHPATRDGPHRHHAIPPDRGKLAAERGAAIAPHATIGTGLFLAASLQVSATLPHLWKHEWQHSVFERNLQLLDSDMGYADGAYRSADRARARRRAGATARL